MTIYEQGAVKRVIIYCVAYLLTGSRLAEFVRTFPPPLTTESPTFPPHHRGAISVRECVAGPPGRVPTESCW